MEYANNYICCKQSLWGDKILNKICTTIGELFVFKEKKTWFTAILKTQDLNLL